MESPHVDMSQLFELYLTAYKKYPAIAHNKTLFDKINNTIRSSSIGDLLHTVHADLIEPGQSSWYIDIIDEGAELLRDTYNWCAVTYSAQTKTYLPAVFTALDDYVATVFIRHIGKSADQIKDKIKRAEHIAFLMIHLATHYATLAKDLEND